jgi:hypothetical protein
LSTKTDEILGKTAARQTSAEFVAFLTDIASIQQRGKEIHIIASKPFDVSAERSSLSSG